MMLTLMQARQYTSCFILCGIYIDGWVESLISHNIEANGFGKLSGLASADRWALWLTNHRGRPLACIWRPSFHFTLSIVGS